MSSKRTRSKNGSCDDSDDETLGAEEQELRRQLQEMEQENRRLQKRAKLASTVASKSRSKDGPRSAMAKEVDKKTRTDLWPVKKFIYNPTKLHDGAKFVLSRIGELKEFKDLNANDRIDAEENWLAIHKYDVRIAMNSQRNYVQQELREFVNKLYHQGEEDQIPNVEEILMLMERKGLSGSQKENLEPKFDFYWDKLLPKVAGHVNWCPTKRHYGLLSTATTPSPIEGEPDIPCVHTSSEGFLVALWEHCYPRWRYTCLQNRNKEEVDPDHEDMKGKDYTTAKSGRKKFGGWTRVGRERVKELTKMCKTARGKASVEAIEKAALKRIRKDNKRDELDAKRKSKPKSKKTAEEYEEEEADSDMEHFGV